MPLPPHALTSSHRGCTAATLKHAEGQTGASRHSLTGWLGVSVSLSLSLSSSSPRCADRMVSGKVTSSGWTTALPPPPPPPAAYITVIFTWFCLHHIATAVSLYNGSSSPSLLLPSLPHFHCQFISFLTCYLPDNLPSPFLPPSLPPCIADSRNVLPLSLSFIPPLLPYSCL